MPTTQQINSLWTPADVMTLMGLISGVFLTALGIFIVKVIDAIKSAKLAVIAAETARLAAQAATSQASVNKGATEQMSKQMDGIQQQVTAALIATPPPIDAKPPKGP